VPPLPLGSHGRESGVGLIAVDTARERYRLRPQNSVSARSDFGCDLIEVKLHSFGVAGRQYEGGAGSAFGGITLFAVERNTTVSIPGADPTQTPRLHRPSAWLGFAHTIS
jgi:hypothetical protein